MTGHASDSVFLARLEYSNVASWMWALWNWSRGDLGLVLPQVTRPSFEERRAYSDTGDAVQFANPKDNGGRQGHRVEIRRREEMEFTSAADYRYPDMLVDPCFKWDESGVKPWKYVVFDKDMSHVASWLGETHDDWRSVTLNYYGGRRDHYMCPMHHVKFEKVEFENHGEFCSGIADYLRGVEK